jgi:predicted transcriptional regulator
MSDTSRTSPSPIKVNAATKDRIRYAAAVLDCSQSAVVDAAMEEFIARHSDELNEGIGRAREALRGGRLTTIAHLLGESPESIERLST